MIITLSIAGIAVAFICLSVFLIQLLRQGIHTLGETNKTLAEVRHAVHGLTQEGNRLLHSATQVTTDLKGKMKAINPLVESAQDVSEVIHDVTNSVRHATSAIMHAHGAEPNTGKTTPPPIPEAAANPRNRLQIKVK